MRSAGRSAIGVSLRDAAEKLVFSFADIGIYRHVARNLDRRGIRWREFTDGEMLKPPRDWPP